MELSDNVQIRAVNSGVRMMLSFLAHGGALACIAYDLATPEWLTAIFAITITWYFATKEMMGEDVLPHWQAMVRAAIRGTHALAGGVGLAILFALGHDIPNWWVGIYGAIIMFYFIELRDPPQATTTPREEPPQWYTY